MSDSLIGTQHEVVGDPDRYVAGAGCYIADLASSIGEATLFVVRSDVAHGRLVNVGLDMVRRAPGVIAAFSASDVRADLGSVPVIEPRNSASPDLIPFLQPVIAVDRVRYVGEPVAVIVAVDRYFAEDAAALVELEIEPLVPVIDSREASGSVQLFDLDNEVARIESSFGDAVAAFRAADVVETLTITVGRHSGVPMETRGLVAEPGPSGSLTVYGASKVVHANQKALAGMLGVSTDSIRMREVDVGGAFGIRGEFYPEDFLVPWAAKMLGRTVSWVEDRREHLLSANQSRDQIHVASIAADERGRLLAISTEFWIDSGAYVRTIGLRVAELTLGEIPGPYRFESYSGVAHCVVSNRTPTGTYRSPGRFEASFVRERMVDRVAARLEIPGDEIRRRNLIRASDMPYRSGIRSAGKDVVLDTGDYVNLFERVNERTKALANELQNVTSRDEWEKVGYATGCFIEKSGLGPFEEAIVEVRDDGTVDVLTGASYLGQGLQKSLSNVVSHALGIPVDSVRIVRVDTNRVSVGIGTYASRSLIMSGSATHNACHELVRVALELAAEEFGVGMEDLIYDGGRITSRGASDFAMSLGELSQRRSKQSPSGEGLSARVRFDKESATYGFGSHGAVVVTNARTGIVHVKHLVLGYDAGVLIDEGVVVGQLQGGAVQAIGGALFERFSYDKTGNPLATTFMDYLLPTAGDAPSMEVVFASSIPLDNPLKARGVGEAGIPAVAAAIASAVEASLACGATLHTTPIMPEAVWELANT